MKHALLPLTLLLTACASPITTAPPSQKPSTTEEVTKAATTPLSDLNLVRAEIPQSLQLALKAPYAQPGGDDDACAAIASEVTALDAVLGADLDMPPNPLHPGLLERGSTLASGAAVGALRGAAEGAIPFRGWVRKLSGAEYYSREVIAAITAGTVRRAYLKGVGEAKACKAPAAPLAKQA